MSDVTQLLHAASTGDPRAAAELLPLVSNKWRRLATHWLVGRARRRLAAKRGAGEACLDADELDIPAPAPDDQLLAVSEALEKFVLLDARKAELVKFWI